MKKLYDIAYMQDKKEISDDCLALIEQLRVFSYHDAGNPYRGLKTIAVPAQDIEKAYPLGAERDGVGMMYADQTSLVPLLVGAIKCLAKQQDSDLSGTEGDMQALQATIAELTARVAALEGTAASETQTSPEAQAATVATTTTTTAKAKAMAK